MTLHYIFEVCACGDEFKLETEDKPHLMQVWREWRKKHRHD